MNEAACRPLDSHEWLGRIEGRPVDMLNVPRSSYTAASGSSQVGERGLRRVLQPWRPLNTGRWLGAGAG